MIRDERTITKLPTGPVNKLKASLNMLSSLQGKEYYVYTGHGDSFPLDGYDLHLAV